MTGANGGLAAAADDPSMHSSQNEQDSRFYAKFAMIPCFEPASQQEAYEMIGEAFDFSEKYQIPVLMRVTTRMPAWFWRFDRLYESKGVKAVYIRTMGLEVDSMRLAALIRRMKEADMSERIGLLREFRSE